jgi:hypothetical protein
MNLPQRSVTAGISVIRNERLQRAFHRMSDNTLLILAAELAAKNKAHFPGEIFKPRELCKLGEVDI